MSAQVKKPSFLLLYLFLSPLVIILQLHFSQVVQNDPKPSALIMVQWQQTLNTEVTIQNLQKSSEVTIENLQTSSAVTIENLQKSQLPSKNCTWPDLKVLNPPGPRTGLVSRPGSGNTWVRHLLQLATGIQTGSVYHERKLKLGGFPGEGLTDGSVIAIKAHNLQRYQNIY